MNWTFFSWFIQRIDYNRWCLNVSEYINKNNGILSNSKMSNEQNRVQKSLGFFSRISLPTFKTFDFFFAFIIDVMFILCSYDLWALKQLKKWLSSPPPPLGLALVYQIFFFFLKAVAMCGRQYTLWFHYYPSFPIIFFFLWIPVFIIFLHFQDRVRRLLSPPLPPPTTLE